MTIHIESQTFHNKNQRDKIEQDLISKGFIEIPTFSKLKHHQYRMSQGTGDSKTFEGPVIYTIEWCIDE